MKSCNRCSQTKPLTAFHSDRSKRDGRASICKACVSERQRQARLVETPEQREARRVYAREYARKIAPARKARYRQWRATAIQVYGGACQCCGEAHTEFLTFDHVGEWGAEHRARDSVAASIVVWLHRNDYPQDGTIQLLCWNCNCARGIYGFCPHQHESSQQPDIGALKASA